MFKLLKKDKKTKARRGVLTTVHGEIQSPFFMPVGTNGTVKSLNCQDLREIGAQIELSNTYHLYLRPGLDVLSNAGGLHQFMSWDRPILTDSGGYQVFSLSKLRKLSDEGVEFRSHLDGSSHMFTPEKVIDIQRVIGSDIMMPLDVCAPYPCDRKEAEESVRFTTEWAKRSRDYYWQKEKQGEQKQFHFGIVQGSVYEDLREQSAKEIVAVDFDGLAIGGVSVGEPVDEMFKALDRSIPFLPEDKPRYFMGIGFPDQIVKAVGEGIDMFDCVLPTRYGRHATAFTHAGRIILKNKVYAQDPGPIDERCSCSVCRNYSRQYIRHLLQSGEMTGLQMVSYHNVYFYINLMREIRAAIDDDCYQDFSKEFIKEYQSSLII